MTKYTDFVNYNLSMLKDMPRTERYRQAIYQTVRPNDVVVDLGCGSGVLSFFACQAGARRVYAIESEVVIELAKQVAMKNGFGDRIVFLNDMSFRVDLPEKADVLLTETIGTFGFDEGMLGSVIDARERFLKPNARIVPQSVELLMVPTELPGFYQHMIDFWTGHHLGIDYSPVRRFAVNNFHPLKLNEGTFLCAPQVLSKVDLRTAGRADLEWQLSYTAGRRGWFHGLAGWFHLELMPGLTLTNAPSDDSHWGLSFFPLETPVLLTRGDRVNGKLEMVNNAAVWKWHVEANGRKLDQSTIYGFPQLPEDRHMLLADAAPRLAPQGEAEHFVLGQLNGERTTAELQTQLQQRFPRQFHTAEQAAAFLRDVVMRNAR